MKGINGNFRCIAVWGLMALSLGLQGLAQAGNGEFTRIFIFGDSLSDAGNVYALTGETAQAPWQIIPDRPYEMGGYQFSNGKTWAQHFARQLRLNRSGNAALFEPGKNGNYAFGGARVRNGLADPLSAATQIARYIGDHGTTADADALYVLQFGGNDLRDALVTANPGIIFAAVDAEIAIIEQLYAQGARHFLVANSADLGLAPAVRLLGAEVQGSLVTLIFNNLLEGRLQLLENDPAHGGISITRLDFFAIVNDIVTSPEQFGIENTTGTCLMLLPPATDFCARPKTYAFWDGVHPTAAVHRVVGDAATALYH